MIRSTLIRLAYGSLQRVGSNVSGEWRRKKRKMDKSEPRYGGGRIESESEGEVQELKTRLFMSEKVWELSVSLWHVNTDNISSCDQCW